MSLPAKYVRPGTVCLKKSNPFVNQRSEHRVFNFSRILGSIGGALGLFVGFSFLDIFSVFYDRMHKWIENK